MSETILAVFLVASCGQYPVGANCPPYGLDGGYGGFSGGTMASGPSDPFFPFDAQQPWVHGHWQEIPAYGGFHYFRPYNYRHVLAQSQVAAGWGMSPTMPYSQEFFNRPAYQPGWGRRGSQSRTTSYAPETPRGYAQQSQRVEYLPSSGSYEREPQYGGPALGSAPDPYAASGMQIDPAGHSRQSRIDALRQQIDLQAQQLQAAQQALEEESRRAPYRR